MAGGEVTGVNGFCENAVGGLLQAPAVCVRTTAEFTSTGVVICAEGHPRHWGSLRTSGTSAEGRLHTGHLP